MLRSPALALAFVLSAALAAADDKDPPKPHVLLKFDGNNKNEGTGDAKVSLKNTEFKDNTLVVNGLYPIDAKHRAKASDVRITTPKLSYDAFTVAVRFKADEFGDNGGPVVVGGPRYRWFQVGADTAGNAAIRLNNATQTFAAKNATLDANKWAVVACSVSVKNRKVILFVNGKKADEFDLPKDFAFAVATSDAKDSDKIWTTVNYSNANTFKGQIDELIVYDTALTADQMAKIPLKP